MRVLNTSPSLLPVIPSITWPHQSMLLPYSHLSPGSNRRGVISAFLELVMTLGCPFSWARRLYFSLKKSYPIPAEWVSSIRVVTSRFGGRSFVERGLLQGRSLDARIGV